MYAFLELFLTRYPQYSKQPFHIAAESYGGTYAPNFAKVINDGNKALKASPDKSLKHINLASVVLANGLTNPLIQYASIPDYLCEGPYAVYDPEGPECQGLRAKVPTCERLVKACYNYNNRFTCMPALLYCNSQLMGPIVREYPSHFHSISFANKCSLPESGRNPYDARKKCNRQEDGDLCYRQMSWIENWLNNPSIKAELGVPPSLEFTSCNMQVNQAFVAAGDGSRNAAALLPDLVNSGVRLLVYAGDADMMCNYMGNERWVEVLDTKFKDEFAKKPEREWRVKGIEGKGKWTQAGTVRSAGGHGATAGNVTFVRVFEAGHMVPYDQPEASLVRSFLDIGVGWATHHSFIGFDYEVDQGRASALISLTPSFMRSGWG